MCKKNYKHKMYDFHDTKNNWSPKILQSYTAGTQRNWVIDLYQKKKFTLDSCKFKF